MYKIYLKQAWALIRQERLFSSVYIVGTGLAISLVMVLSIVFYVKMASIYPEMDRDRLLTVKSAALKNEKGGTSSGPVSPRFVEECLAGVPGLEALALCCDDAASAFVQPVGSPVQIPVMKMGVLESILLPFPGGQAFHRGRFPVGDARGGNRPLTGQEALWRR